MRSLSSLLVSSVSMTLEYFRPSVFKKKKITFILTKYIHTHVLYLLNIRISFKLLLTSQHWFPAYSLSLATSSSALNDFKSLHSHAIFSHNFLSFLSPTLTFILPLSCGRNQAMISSSDISLHLHNLNKFMTNLLHWFKEDL